VCVGTNWEATEVQRLKFSRMREDEGRLLSGVCRNELGVNGGPEVKVLSNEG